MPISIPAPARRPRSAGAPVWVQGVILMSEGSLLRRIQKLNRPLLARLGATPAWGWVWVNFVTPVDKQVHRWTKGGLAMSAIGAPTLFLTTTGRKSGEPRTTPVLYLENGDDLIVVAANWGQKQHPAWSGNLLATPRATVQIGRRTSEVEARLATEEETQRLWPMLLTVWPAWKDYRSRSGRDLRVFVLTPIPLDNALGRW